MQYYYTRVYFCSTENYVFLAAEVTATQGGSTHSTPVFLCVFGCGRSHFHVHYNAVKLCLRNPYAQFHLRSTFLLQVDAFFFMGYLDYDDRYRNMCIQFKNIDAPPTIAPKATVNRGCSTKVYVWEPHHNRLKLPTAGKRRSSLPR